MAMPQGFVAGLTPQQRSAIQASGTHIDDVQNALIFQRTPLPGRWVKVGSDFYMTDREGYFNVPSVPAGVTSLDVFHGLRDTIPEASFPLDAAGFGASKATAPNHIESNRFPAPDGMNPTSATTAAPAPPASETKLHHADPGLNWLVGNLPDGCPGRCEVTDPGVSSNDAACCADYDGMGDDLPRSRGTSWPDCTVKANLNFIDSTCYKWSFGALGTACLNEAAYQCKIHSCPDGQTQYPGCFLNHKYRNCQTLDNHDFVVPVSATVAAGQKITIHVRNNTEANETRITGLTGGNGTLECATYGPSLDGSALLHYSDDEQQHYKDVDLTYTAPCTAKPPTPVNLNFEAAGMTLTMVINVTPPKQTCGNPPRCVDLNNDDQNCGSCGHNCPPGTACRSGACVGYPY